jgi:type IV pilus assembly protein PilO
VTLHDIEVKPEITTAFDQLTLEVTARTYRYLDEEELSEAEAAKAKTPGGPKG